MFIAKLVPFAVFGLIIFGFMFLLSLRSRPHAAKPRSQLVPCIGCVGLALIASCWLAGVDPPFITPSPRALFEESRLGVTRSDIRDQIREMEDRVPDTLRDMESRLPQHSADLEREMMNNAHKYGLSESDVRAQVREIESQARQQIRGMEGDVRRQIRDLEEPTWEELRRIERGR